MQHKRGFDNYKYFLQNKQKKQQPKKPTTKPQKQTHNVLMRRET